MSNLGIIRNPRWKIRNRQADPDPIPDPTYENAMRNADFPQWQCAVPKEFYGRFTSMPMHCQLAVWKESGMKTPFEVEAEENVQEVTNHKSTANPGPSAGPSEGARGEDATAAQRAVHRLMTHALGSTRKPTTHTGEQTGDDDDDDPIRVETHTSTAIISNRGEKGSGIGRPLETGWTEPGSHDEDSVVGIWYRPSSGVETDVANRIRKIVEQANKSESCTKAFEEIGARPIWKQRVVFVMEDVFKDESADSFWGLGTTVPTDMREIFRKFERAMDVSTIGMVDPHNIGFIGITNEALSGKEYLDVVVIHSLLHTGGLGPQEKSWSDIIWDFINGESKHDLASYGEKYNNVLRACTSSGGSKQLWGQ